MTQPRITTTAQLLAAIPALLGYVPADSGSFVVIALETDPAGGSDGAQRRARELHRADPGR